MFSESHVGVLIEHLDGNIKLLAESQMAFREETHRDFKNVWSELKSSRSDMNINLKIIFDRLSAIENEMAQIKAELKNITNIKADKKSLDAIEKKVSRLELELGGYRQMIAEAKKS